MEVQVCVSYHYQIGVQSPQGSLKESHQCYSYGSELVLMFLTAPMEARQSKWRGEFNYYSEVRYTVYLCLTYN